MLQFVALNFSCVAFIKSAPRSRSRSRTATPYHCYLFVSIIFIFYISRYGFCACWHRSQQNDKLEIAHHLCFQQWAKIVEEMSYLSTLFWIQENISSAACCPVTNSLIVYVFIIFFFCFFFVRAIAHFVHGEYLCMSTVFACSPNYFRIFKLFCCCLYGVFVCERCWFLLYLVVHAIDLFISFLMTFLVWIFIYWTYIIICSNLMRKIT